MMGDARGGLDCICVSWFSEVFLVCSWVVVWVTVVVSFWVLSSWVMMMVPPPCSIRAFTMSWTGAGIPEGAGIGPAGLSGVAGLSCPGVCIGRKVMVVVVFRVFRMLCAALSIFWEVMVVVDLLVLERCLLLRQPCIIRIDARTMVTLIRCVVFIVCCLF